MQRPRSISRVLAAALAVTAAVACNAILGNESDYHLATAGGRTTCKLNSDCATGKVCIFETCSDPCHEDIDCEPGYRCLDTDGVGTACVTSAQAKCTGSDCPAGTTCSAGTCRTTCGAGECRSDQTCAGGVCVGNDTSHDPPKGTGGAAGAGGGGGRSSSGGSAGRDSGAGAGGRGGLDGSVESGAGGDGQAGAGGDGGSDPCLGVTCDQQMPAECHDANTRRTFDPIGSCSAGQCTYPHTDTVCPFGCASGVCNADPCVAIKCTTPPANTCEDATHLKAYDTQGTCTGTTCTYTSQLVPCDCSGGACQTDPCATVTCNGPAPAARCETPTTRRTFSSTGTCSGGSCTYPPTDTTCPFGCANGVCNPDPCATVTCNGPPAAFCANPSTRTSYAANGTCTGGNCSYTSTDTPCAFGCASGACKPDPCLGVTCNAVAPSCVSLTTLETNVVPGTCTGGTCSYSRTTTTCSNKTCVGTACTGVCAQGQKRCLSNGIQNCDSSGQWTTPPATCSNQACVNGICTGNCTPNPTPTQCLDGNTPQFCNNSGAYQAAPDCSAPTPACLNGTCVGCTTPTQCSVTNDCYNATCTTNSCGQQPKAVNSPCTAGIGWVCNGSGTCSECSTTASGNCSQTEVCRSFACVNAVHTVGWENSTAATSLLGADQIYMLRLPPMPYNATIVALGAVGVGSGSMKLALYADDGTGTKPSTAAPVAATATSIALGISAVETTNFLPQPTSLTQGATYWLAFKLNIVANIRAQANASQVGLRVTSQPFGDAFPANPAGGSPLTVNGNEFAVYMRVHDTN